MGALFYGYNMDYNIEHLNQINIHSLRNLARKIGVKAPSSLKKQELIDQILLIESGKNQPYRPIKQGRPLKPIVDINTFLDINLVKTKQELISSILKDIEKTLNKYL